MLALACVGVLDADGYHREDDGAVLIVRGSGFVRRPSRPELRVASVFPDLLLSTTLANPRAALEHYLAYYGLTLGNQLQARFDAQGRLVELAARPASAGKIDLEPPPGLELRG
jgi:hypothetical protein